MSNELSAEYIRAHELDVRIKTSAQLAQKSLYDMCKCLKEMRDGKLYKELGYKNYEEYCETEVGIKRRNAYRYISIIENMNPDFVQATAQNIGTEKLYLLSTLSEYERHEIKERVEVEDITTRQLKAEIDKLKDENKKAAENAESRIKALQTRLDDTGNAMRKATAEANGLAEKNIELERQIKELESRPIEVVASPVNEETEKIKQECADLRSALNEQKAAYEKRLAESSPHIQKDETAVFKAYFTAAYHAFQDLVGFVKQAENKAMMQEKVRQLTDTVMQSMEA